MASGVLQLLEDDEAVGGDPRLKATPAGGHVRAEVADVDAAVDARVAVEHLALGTVRQP